MASVAPKEDAKDTIMTAVCTSKINPDSKQEEVLPVRRAL